MRLLIFIISILIVIPSFGQKTKKKEDETTGQVFSEGVVYSLPRAGIKVNLKATCTYFTAGPFAQYAEQLLGLGNIKTTNSSGWVIDDMKIEVFSEPDPESTFKTKGNAASLINLSPTGCLAGINAGSSAADLHSLVAGYSLKVNTAQIQSAFSNLTSTSWFSQGDSTNNFKVVRISPEKKAAEAVAKIFECRRIRYDIAAGLLDEFHPDGKAYEASLKELDLIEKENLMLFTGKTYQKQYSFGFVYIPSSKPVKGDVLFRFSDEKGVLPGSDLSGKPVTIDIQPSDLPSDKKGLASSENPNAGASGVFYRIPAMADYRILQDMQVISSGRILIPQMGQTAPFPEELLDGSYAVEIHPETGAIKHVQKK
jgi:hypothetical protein